MLKVVVESAKGIPKKTLGLPDPIAGVIFKGESGWNFGRIFHSVMKLEQILQCRTMESMSLKKVLL